MEKYYDYSVDDYQFVEAISGLFDCGNLQYLHEMHIDEYEFFDKPGKDSDTIFHQKFYNKMRSGWPEFLELYQKFIREFIAPITNAKDQLIYQKWPTFRVHLPNNVAVGGWHKDSDYNHPLGETNFILALTPMFESNTTIAESEPGKMDFHQLELMPGQIVRFNGNQCTHGNLPNKTGVTRVSFDFRIMMPEDYNSNYRLTSLSKGNKFLIGHYYEVMEI